MIFASYSFLAFFLVVMLGFLILNKFKFYAVAEIWLVLASFYFYAQGSPSFLPFFIGTVFFNYVIGMMIIGQSGKYALRNKRFLLAIGLLENIALLGYFKYVDFFITNVNFLAGTEYALKGIALPIGISFFTFQLIAYLVDCYRGETEEYSVVKYLLFITFFPQLIVGPIVHHKDIVPQFDAGKHRKIDWNNVMLATLIFSIGTAKKTLIADPLTAFAADYFRNVYVLDIWRTWTSSLAYTISYYFDLSGYADMAIGLALFFNMKIPQNFNSPYKARNFQIYWRRWHMSLSKFLGDYVFRLVYRKGAGSWNFYLATMFTFFVSGFWHGAGWQFVLWGILNGVFVCMAAFATRKKWSMPFPIAWTITFIGVVLMRIMFVSLSIKDAFHVYGALFDFSQFAGWSKMAILGDLRHFLVFNLYTISVLVVGMAIAFFGKNTKEINESFKPSLKYAVISGVLLVASLFQMTSVTDFLYFQF